MDPWLAWNNAVPLSLAYVRFAPKDKARRYQELSEAHFLPAVLKRADERMCEGEDAWKALQGSVLSSQDLNRLRDELRSACVHFVRIDALKAYGFAIPRRPDHEPQPIPPDLWRGIINWEKSTLQANGLKMEGVRLIPPHWEDQLVAKQAKPLDTPRTGRRSRETQILEAFEALDAAGKIDYAKPMKAHFPLIREWVLAKYPDDPDGEKGLSDKTIPKYIRDRFNAGKRDSKL